MRVHLAIIITAAASIPLCAAPRDWDRYPPVVQRESPSTVFALGDIHGDYGRLVQLLAAAHIIPAAPVESGRPVWSARDAVLVVTGDMIDKGERPLAVLRFLMALRSEAAKAGGEVIALSGNHEAELLAHADPLKHAELAVDLQRADLSLDQVAACRGDIGEFLCSLPFAARVGDWFFSHAGDTGGRSLAVLSSAIRNGQYDLAAPDSILEARLGEGQNWIASADSAVSVRQKLAARASALGVQHMVQGHQHSGVAFAGGVSRRPGEMFQAWGLLFLIDVGMSSEIDDSRGALLKIVKGRAVAVCPNRAQTLLWSAATKTEFGRAAACR